METFYDGYIVNAIVDACYRLMKSGRWEPVKAGFKAPGRAQKAKTGTDQGDGLGRRKSPSSMAGAAVIRTERLPNVRIKRHSGEWEHRQIIENFE